MQRRSLLQASAALGATGLATTLLGCASTPTPTRARVVVVGGGYGGATAAKYVRLLSEQQIDVVLIEPNPSFISCPLSNLVVGGSRSLPELTVSYEALQRRHGVQVVRDSVTAIDAAGHKVRLASGVEIAYERLILSPGIELNFEAIEGLKAAHERGRVLQAWKAGPETLALQKQLQAMPAGGTFVISIPEAPYRCPPGPYERASVVAGWLKAHNPRAKLLIVDANPDVTSKAPLFKKVWAEDYKGIVEYRPQHKATAVDAAGRRLKFEVQEDVVGDVLNVLPPMSAGRIAQSAGLATVNKRWAGIDYLSFESLVAKDIHVIGDAIQVAPAMPKSGHMANNHAKVAAAAVVSRLYGWEPNPAPVLSNTCYSFIDAQRVIHVASVHEYVAAEKTFKAVAGSGGVSPGPTEQEGRYAWNWARTIWADSLG
ncbi:MAG TPA: NAD(P)/FAD-dependent oxidoreductase [Ideonella sp.]|nr:NAD(P)/FAD-dependent oxidoreductase [Ideonella sp.]